MDTTSTPLDNTINISYHQAPDPRSRTPSKEILPSRTWFCLCGHDCWDMLGSANATVRIGCSHCLYSPDCIGWWGEMVVWVTTSYWLLGSAEDSACSYAGTTKPIRELGVLGVQESTRESSNGVNRPQRTYRRDSSTASVPASVSVSRVHPQR